MRKNLSDFKKTSISAVLSLQKQRITEKGPLPFTEEKVLSVFSRPHSFLAFCFLKQSHGATYRIQTQSRPTT